MTAKQWKTKIKKACEDAGTYQKCFDSAILTLAAILQKRDEAEALFEEQGREYILRHTNAAGAENSEQNPLVRMINDLNRDALTYWRDLGLTPKGLKAISENAVKPAKKETDLTKALKALAGGADA